MQTIILYAAAGGVVGALRDYANAKDASATAPMLARGVAAEIKLRLFAGTDRADAYPLSELSNIAAWRFVLDNDFNSATAPLIVADNAAIAVATVTDTIEDSERSYTEVSIQISAMDTEELAAAIGTSASITLGGELSGYDADGSAVFLLQIDGLTVRNRRESAGEPTPVAGEYLTEAQTRALIAGIDLTGNVSIISNNVEISNLKYSAALGYYADLTNANDTVKTVYNLTDCTQVSLHLASANSAITGNIIVEINIEGETQRAVVPVGETGAWHVIAIDAMRSGRLTVKLVTGLTDAGAPVSVIVDGLRTVCAWVPQSTGRVERQVGAKPVLYSDAAGYYMSLDASYGINFCYPVSGITAVALKLKSANSAITGNVALTLTVGAATKSAVIAVGAADAWALITLDAPASGAVAVVRDTASASDTLNDSGTVVSAVVSDLNYYYQEN